MSIKSNVTEQDMIILRKLAEQQKNQRVVKIKMIFLKQTLGFKLAESLSPIIKNVDEVNEITKKLGEIVKKSDGEDENTQRPAIENITGTQPLRDTLTLMTRSKNFLELEEKTKRDVFWNDVFIKPLGEKRIRIKKDEYVKTPDFQAYFTNTKLTIEFLDNVEKETALYILKNVGLYDNKPKRVEISYKKRKMLCKSYQKQ